MEGEGGGGLRKPARSSCHGGTFVCGGPMVVVTSFASRHCPAHLPPPFHGGTCEPPVIFSSRCTQMTFIRLPPRAGPTRPAATFTVSIAGRGAQPVPPEESAVSWSPASQTQDLSFTGQSPNQVSSLSTDTQVNTSNAATASGHPFLARQ